MELKTVIVYCINCREHPHNNTLATIILALTSMIFFISKPSSTLMAIPAPCCYLTAWLDQQSSYFCLTFFCLLAIITELLRRRTPWRQQIEILAFAISRITLSIFWSSFPVQILIFSILHDWKILFLINLVNLKYMRPKYKSVCGQYLTPRQMCSSICSSKMDSFSSPRWKINSKS